MTLRDNGSVYAWVDTNNEDDGFAGRNGRDVVTQNVTTNDDFVEGNLGKNRVFLGKGSEKRRLYELASKSKVARGRERGGFTNAFRPQTTDDLYDTNDR